MRLCEKCKEENKYNGWTNYETWSIALFIDNEQEWYNEVREMITKTIEDYDAMVLIKEFIEDNLITTELTPYQSQMISASLSEVNWKEIVQHYKEE